MTVTNTTAIEVFVGNGSDVTPYPINIQRDRDEDLFVLLDGVPTDDFTVTPSGIVTGTAIPGTVEVTVYRYTPRTQESPFPSNTNPSPADVRAAVNKLTLMIQEMSGNPQPGSKSLTFPLTEPVEFSTQLPTAFDRRAMILGFDGGTGELKLYPRSDFGFNEELTGVAILEADNLFLGRNVFQRQVGHVPVELEDTFIIHWNCYRGNLATLTLEGNRFLANPTNIVPGTYILRVVQDAVGSRLLSFGSRFKTPGGEAIVLTTTPEHGDILTFINFGGSDLYLVSQYDFVVDTTVEEPELDWPANTITYLGEPILFNGSYLTYTAPE